MGNSNFHKSKERKPRTKLDRRAPFKSPGERILIVCEGKKTEPYYFEELRHHYRLSSTNIVITGNCSSSPNKVLDKAQKEYFKAEKQRNPFNKVYCVFDRDTHATYDYTVQAIGKAKPKNTFFAITSDPCFEYWLLLHFHRTTKNYRGTHNHSSADQVIEDLKNYLPNYSKNSREYLKELMLRLDTAISNAVKVNEYATIERNSPSTKVVVLVQYLKSKRS